MMRKPIRHHEDASIKAADRRSDERYPPEVEPTFVWVAVDKCVRAKVIDESVGGIGLRVSTIEPFEIGFEVRVELSDGKRRTATVVYAKELDDGEYRLGLTWL
jgi:hypothetical protein